MSALDFGARGMVAQLRANSRLLADANRLSSANRLASGRPVRLSSFGNSIVAGVASRNILDTATRTSGRFQLGPNYGVPGDRTSQMRARVDAVVNCDAVLLMEGPNDAANSVSTRAHMDNFRAMIENFLARGIVPAIVAPTPHNNYPGAIESYRWAEMLLAAEYGIDFFDPWIEFTDVATGQWVSGAASDGVHPTTATSDTAIANLTAMLKEASKTELYVPRSSVADPQAYLISGGNGMFTTGSAPSPTGWQRVGATAYTGAIISAPAGHRGNFYQATSNGAGGTPYLRKRMSGLHQAGDELLVTFAYRHTFASGSTGYVNITGGGGITGGQNGGGNITGQLGYNQSLARFVARLKTTTTADIDLNLSIGNTGTGAVSEIGEVEIVNLTKLRER